MYFTLECWRRISLVEFFSPPSDFSLRNPTSSPPKHCAFDLRRSVCFLRHRRPLRLLYKIFSVTITLKVEDTDPERSLYNENCYAGGLIEYVKWLNADKGLSMSMNNEFTKKGFQQNMCTLLHTQ